MCGITGYFSITDEADCSGYYDAHRLIRHRGPDDEGFAALVDGRAVRFRGDDSVPEMNALPHIRELRGSRVVLGHRRLTILDLTHLGHQPMRDPSTDHFIVFNGEIFNYLELRDELSRLGHVFEGHSDTEVALKAYAEWGEEAFKRFNGMWALAIWNQSGNRLVLSRDRFGIKPLYYTESNGEVCFASETKFMKAFGKRRWHLNEEACADYLYRMRIDHDDDTLLHDIREVPPAHTLVFDASGASSYQYWGLVPSEDTTSLSAAVDMMRSLFDDSLSLRMRSDVEVGSLLSGGLDSSLIVCALHGLGYVSDDRTLKTFSAVFEDERYSEKRYVDAVSEAIPVVPSFVWPSAEEVPAYIDDLIFHIEDPFRSLSQFLQYRLYEEIAGATEVKVLLNGQGGDELFGGYTNHYFMHFASLLARGHLGRFIGEVNAFRRSRPYTIGQITRRVHRFYSDAKAEPVAFFNKRTYREVTGSPLREYLKYDDRTSMAFGLEARPPFLDHRLVEFAFNLCEGLKITGMENKRLERVYARDFVPSLVTERTDKMGFVSPQEQWQRTHLRETMAQLVPHLDGVLRFGTRSEQESGRRRFEEYVQGESNDWTFAWRVYCMSRWLELNSDSLV